MNVLSIFDQRISAIFEESVPGQRKPFSFKRLAKRAVREMEDETFVIDGIDTAPALYTVLVSSKDDALMRPMYASICDEISQLVEAQAKKRGYAFVGRPLVRFMVDPGLRGGRFSVFAENIDPRTLARLRDEENAYLGITSPHNMPSDQGFVPDIVPMEEQEPAPIASQVDFVEQPDVDEEALDEPKMEEEPVDDPLSVPTDIPSSRPEVVAAAAIASIDLSAEDDELDEPELIEEQIEEIAEEPPAKEPAHAFDLEPDAEDDFEPEKKPEVDAEPVEEPGELDAPSAFAVAAVAPEFEEVPTTRARHADQEAVPTPEPTTFSLESALNEPQTKPVRPQGDTCTLTDTATGRTYQIIVRRTPIGRERVGGGIVLRDPNVSRRHAELVFENNVWMIRDLGSTNGTLVDDMDVREAMLTDGDVITIGLTNLEFKAG